MRRVLLPSSLALLLLVAAAGSAWKPRRSGPRAEITAVARVETEPRRTVHRNHREFEELDVTILSAEKVAPSAATGDFSLPIDTTNRVHVVHDLTCGGNWIDVQPGDRVEIKGEYFRLRRGGHRIHFTHPADESCGRATGHPDGYLRLAGDQVGSVKPERELFASTVRPVLARRCICHEKGGKMYARLPFDDPSVVSSNAGGVRRRLKGDDLAALENWLATLNQGAPPPSQN